MEEKERKKEIYLTEKARVEKLVQLYSCYRTGVNNYKVVHFREILKRCEAKKRITISLISELQKCI